MIECLDEIETNGYGVRLDQDILNDINLKARKKFKVASCTYPQGHEARTPST